MNAAHRIDRIPLEPFRFHVRSSSGRTYLVDLQANNRNGWCGCWDYEFRRNVALRQQEGRASQQSRCKHIQAVRDWLYRDLTGRRPASQEIRDWVLNRAISRIENRTGLVEEERY